MRDGLRKGLCLHFYTPEDEPDPGETEEERQRRKRQAIARNLRALLDAAPDEER